MSDLEERFAHLATLVERGRAASMALGPVIRGELPELPPEPDTKDFYLFGVLGAKNVGKSSLVAAVLGLTHAPEEDRELGEGTRSPKVFASPELMPRVLSCFAKAGVEAEPSRDAGRVAGLEKVAFVDLPDIESRFDDHLPMVMAVNGEVDGLLIVRTAESSFDETFLAKLRAFRRPQMDVYLVMNKFDDWVAARDGDEGEARAVCTEHLAEVLRGLELSTEDVFLTDARPPGVRENDGYDLPRLGQQLLQDKSTEELERAKLRAWVFSLRCWTDGVRAAGDLTRGRRAMGDIFERCARVSEGLGGDAGVSAMDELVPERTRSGFDRFLARSLAATRQVELAESRLVRQVFHHRVELLPFARVLAAPLFLVGEVLDGVLRRMSTSSADVAASADPRETEEAVGALVESLNDSLELERSALEAAYQGVPGPRVLPVEDGRRQLQTVLHGALVRREEAVVARVQSPWFTYRLAMWIPMLWFLVGRSMTRLYLEKGLTLDAEVLGATLLVALLELTTPAYLISAAGLLVVFYGAVLLREYHRAFRAVHDDDLLHSGQQDWAADVGRDLYRSLVGEAIPERFRRLGQRLDDAALELQALEQGLEELDPEAAADAARSEDGRDGAADA